MSKDDEDWLALLSGAAAEDAKESTRHEAMRLRETISEMKRHDSVLNKADTADLDDVWSRIEHYGQRTGAFPSPTVKDPGGGRVRGRLLAVLSATGAIVVTRHGCANDMPTLHDVEAFIASQGGW